MSAPPSREVMTKNPSETTPSGPTTHMSSPSGGHSGGTKTSGAEPMSTSPTSTAASPQSSSTMGSIKSGFKKIGHAIDSGVSSFMRELGGNIRVNCPSCSGLMLSPPNEFVECPKCHNQFMSPTASERTAEVSSQLKKGAEETWAKRGESIGHATGQQTGQPATGGGHTTTTTHGPSQTTVGSTHTTDL